MEFKYAIVFKTYSWDDFIERQFLRYKALAGSFDLFVSVDETNGSVGPIPHDRVIRTSNAQLIRSGLPNRFERGPLIWWNADYPHYEFLHLQPDYDYYIFVEYDSLIQRDLDSMMARIAEAEADFVTMPIRGDVRDWFWTKFHQPTYGLDEIGGSLNCVAVFSRRALQLLDRRRREMGREPSVRYWPNSEVFLATEIRRAGYRTLSLEEFGSLRHFEWFPPTLEDDLLSMADCAFIHPILDRRRYVQNLLKSSADIRNYLLPHSPLRQHLARLPRKDYMPLLPAAVRRRLWSLVKDRVVVVLLRLLARLSQTGPRMSGNPPIEVQAPRKQCDARSGKVPPLLAGVQDHPR